MSIFLWDSEPNKIYVWSNEVSAVFVWDTQVRPSGWKPWANTIAYRPLENDTNDATWTFTTSTSTWITYTTVWWVTSAHGARNCEVIVTPWNIITTSLTGQTISLWYYVATQTTSYRRYLVTFSSKWYNCSWVCLKDGKIQYSEGVSWYWTSSIIANAWTNVIITWDSNARKMYINWTLVYTWSWSSSPRWNRPNNYDNVQYIMSPWANYNESIEWNMKDLIFEKVARTAQEISDYYNQTKSKYGL